MTLPHKPPPVLSDFLTPEQMQAIASEVDSALNTHGHFVVKLVFDKMELKFVQVEVSKRAPKGRPESSKSTL